MRIPITDHTQHNWLVHSLLADFKIEDVWHLPIQLEKTHSLEDVLREFSSALVSIEKRGIPGRLFQFRVFLGKVFGWDEKKVHSELVQGSIRERYAHQNKLTWQDLPHPGDGEFVPVYKLESEVLSEIENATVHAAIHLSRVETSNESFTVNMTIYVKAKGLFGRFYMLLIKPFRLFIIYPALLRTIKNSWEKHLKTAYSEES